MTRVKKCGLLFAASGASVVLLALAYRLGQEAGRRLEQERAFRKEAIDAGYYLPRIEVETRAEAEIAAFAHSADDAPAAAICLEPFDCIRVVWPFEIVDKAPGVSRPHLRLREGANRFAQPGAGVAEFAFVTRRPAAVAIYLHCRGADECSNSILCRVDSGNFTFVEIPPPYGVWRWQPVYRRFYLQPGIHRLTFMASEDGIEIDRIALASVLPRKAEEIRQLCENAARKEPPFFETLPVASPFLPAIGPLTAQAFAVESLVIGAGHRNALGVYLHLNANRKITGRVRVFSERGGIEICRQFALTPQNRSAWLEMPLGFAGGASVSVPTLIEVFAGETLIHAQRLDFIRPLAWAFLGPFPDEAGKGVDAALPPDEIIGSLFTLPTISGYEWKRSSDGSYYDEFGVVDLNKVFGFPRKSGRQNPPLVAYAVTCVPQWFPNPHQSLAYGGDDGVRVWLNGRELGRSDTGCPLEMNRFALGTALNAGCNAFVFKVGQRDGYWQLLFEPEWRSPYGMQDFLYVLPFEKWRMDNPLRRLLRPFSPFAQN